MPERPDPYAAVRFISQVRKAQFLLRILQLQLKTLTYAVFNLDAQLQETPHPQDSSRRRRNCCVAAVILAG
jgi:hypothetical protein